MAEILKLGKNDKFDFAPKGTFGAGAKYKWTEWFDGNLRILKQGTLQQMSAGEADFPNEGGKTGKGISAIAMSPKILTAARKRFKVVSTSRRINPNDKRMRQHLEDRGIKVDSEGRLTGAIILQARDMMEDEKQAELVRRKEEKVRRDALHAANGTTTTPDVVNETEAADDDELMDETAE